MTHDSTIAAKTAEKKASSAKKAALRGTHGKVTKKVRTSATFRRPKTLRLPRAPKYARKSVIKPNKLDAFAILRYPLNTESAMRKIEDLNTLVFIVDIKSNKRQIEEAVKKLYDVTVDKIHTLVRYTTRFVPFVHDEN